MICTSMVELTIRLANYFALYNVNRRHQLLAYTKPQAASPTRQTDGWMNNTFTACASASRVQPWFAT